MIYMSINTHDYENDVRVMINAFFPEEKIRTEEPELARLKVEIQIMETQIQGWITGETEYRIDCQGESKDRKALRNLLKRQLYQCFYEYTGKSLPWGTLTGIRPVKIPLAMLEEGCSEEEIRNTLQGEYLTNEDKTDLSIQVAKHEFQLLSTIDYKKGYSLYIGIPFCPTTCLYCSFTSYPLSMWKNRVDEYLDALFLELTFLKEVLAHKQPDSIYIGGGTPTTLLPEQFDRLFIFLRENFDLSKLKEFTVEAGRPDSIDREKLLMLKKHGVDRISINPQTMNDKTLELIGRRHNVEQIVEAFHLARACGFDNINMDLIVGLPGETKEDVAHTLEALRELNPDNLTVHSLAIKRAAGLNILREKYAEYTIENNQDIMDMTYAFAKALGMEPYYLYRQKNMAGNLENVGYAKPGKMGVYNILIMEEKQSILAAGAGAQSKIVFHGGNRVERIENVKDVANYIDRVDEMINRKRRFFDAESKEW